MNTNIKNVTIEFICDNCHKKKIIYLSVSMDMDNLVRRISNKKCLTCEKGNLDVARINFSYDNS